MCNVFGPHTIWQSRNFILITKSHTKAYFNCEIFIKKCIASKSDMMVVDRSNVSTSMSKDKLDIVYYVLWVHSMPFSQLGCGIQPSYNVP
jgi:hypothetical protein